MSQSQNTDILVIGAGPVGLFTVFEAGLLGLKCTLVDNLDRPGGQCTELYPEKPIYDIPGVPLQTAQEHVDALVEQIKPFDYDLHLSQRVDVIENLGTEAEPHFKVTTSEGQTFTTPNIFIAAGAGSFEPRRPPIDAPDRLQGKGVEYAVRNRANYAGKHIIIFGGGDSALDWAVELAPEAASTTLVHRRDQFRGAPHTEQQMRALVADGKINLKTPYTVQDILGEDQVSGARVRNFETKESEDLEADELLFLFGLNKKLGPINDWNLTMAGKKIDVNTHTFETNVPGIFAVGDINDYPGKLDLILCGFHETTLAVQQAWRYCNPGESRVPFGYTTSNTRLQKKIGVA